MKRLFAFMMVLAMVLSLGVTAFATQNPGSITISNATVGHTYNLYKIFRATVSADKNIAYSIKTTDPFFNILFQDEDFVTDEDPYYNPHFIYNPTTEAVTQRDPEGDDALTKYLNDLMYVKDTEDEDQDGNTTEMVVRKDLRPVSSATAATETVEFTGLEYGYYLITSTLGSTVTINSTKPHANVIDKNQTSGGLDKLVWDAEADNGKGAWVTDNSVNVGDTVKFKIDFTATNYKGDEAVTEYILKDTLNPTNWAKIDINSIKVTIGDGDDAEVLEKGTDWVLVNGSDSGFEIKFPWQETNDKGETSFKHAATVEVVVKYEATVLAAAAENKPAVKNNTAEFETDSKTTNTRLYNLGFTKVDGADTTKKLEGAQFKLYSDAACTKEILVTGADGVYRVKTAEETASTITTPAGGQVVIMGLKEGTYYLKETVAPAGYNLMADATAVEIVKNKSTEVEVNGTKYVINNNAEINIKNNTGVELPSTGGEGTMKMITIGTIIAIGFAVLLITNKKMTAYQD